MCDCMFSRHPGIVCSALGCFCHDDPPVLFNEPVEYHKYPNRKIEKPSDLKEYGMPVVLYIDGERLIIGYAKTEEDKIVIKLDNALRVISNLQNLSTESTGYPVELAIGPIVEKNACNCPPAGGFGFHKENKDA